MPHLAISPVRPYLRTITDWQAEQRPEGVRITFKPVDLRAHARVLLEPVPLATAPGAADPLAVHWTAAGIDAIRQDNGTIALTVVPSTLPILQGGLVDGDDPDGMAAGGAGARTT
ncbi:hypothetical protein [Actinomadura terrae]|uniref:hypothetical protein n=1 Tax=Actinomadura terrae TaxID=604353 RepID=UPI001FA6CEAE|nr:hypothetical protein [Actinomadura terrae]